MKLDLHLHSTYSDGRLPVRELADALGEAGVTHAALTDHDTLAGFVEFKDTCAGRGIRAIPGAEISAQHLGKPVHILAFNVDPSSRRLLSFLRGLNDFRRSSYLNQLPVIDANLQAVGRPPLSHARLESKPTNYFSPVGISRFIVEEGSASTVDDAMRFLKGVTGTVPHVPPPEAIAEIHAAGGMAVLAHPLAPRLSLRESLTDPAAWERTIAQWAAAGLDGLEVYTPAHTPDSARTAARLAAAHGLLATGGSDWHGPLEKVGGGILEYIPHYASTPGAPGLPRAAAARIAMALGL